MSRTSRFARKNTRRFTRWTHWAVTQGWRSLARRISSAFQSHAAWSAKAWGAVYTSSFSGRPD